MDMYRNSILGRIIFRKATFRPLSGPISGSIGPYPAPCSAPSAPIRPCPVGPIAHTRNQIEIVVLIPPQDFKINANPKATHTNVLILGSGMDYQFQEYKNKVQRVPTYKNTYAEARRCNLEIWWIPCEPPGDNLGALMYVCIQLET